jgi:hypothetical protein
MLLFCSISLNAFTQNSPDTVIYKLNSYEEFRKKKDSLSKKGISFKWKEQYGTVASGGGSHYGKKGTGKCIIYQYKECIIKTRRKGGELVF